MEQPDNDEMERAVYERLVEELELPSLILDKFWGSIEIQFQNGFPVTIKKTETKKVKGNNPDGHAKDTR
jgi:hypothetical protein